MNRTDLYRNIRERLTWRRAVAGRDDVIPVGRVRFGDLRRQEPFSRHFGTERGMPVMRYYINRFVESRAADITGAVLEVDQDSYTRRFGRDVTRSDVVHPDNSNPKANVIADFAKAGHLPADTYDCIICTETLQYVYEIKDAIRHLYRMLKPGGVLLVTMMSISPIDAVEQPRWGDLWRLTTTCLDRLLKETFPAEGVDVSSRGNVLTATAYLYGLSVEDLEPEEVTFQDPAIQLVVCARAVKPK